MDDACHSKPETLEDRFRRALATDPALFDFVTASNGTFWRVWHPGAPDQEWLSPALRDAVTSDARGGRTLEAIRLGSAPDQPCAVRGGAGVHIEGQRMTWATRRVLEDTADEICVSVFTPVDGPGGPGQASASAMMSVILNMVHCAVIGFDRSGDVVFLNPMARHFLEVGVADPPFAWTSDLRFLGPDGRSGLGDVLSPERLSRRPVRGLLGVMSAASHRKHRYVRVTSAPAGLCGSDIQCVLLLEDVTESEVIRQHLGTTARLDALGQMTGGIAHDFNNVLATIQYALALAERDVPDTVERGYLDVARASIARASDLTQRLLTFAKQRPNTARSWPVAGVLDDMRAIVEPFLDASIELCVDPGSDGLCVYCDRSQLECALVNLVLNSRDALRDVSGPGVIRIAATAIPDDALAAVRPSRDTDRGIDTGSRPIAGGHGEVGQTDYDTGGPAPGGVAIEVTDTGPGMAEGVLDRAVDPFFTTKSPDIGSGLGLPMVLGFCNGAGGALHIASRPDAGTSVRMLLPAGRPAVDLAASTPPRPDAPGPGQPVVLVVEDEPSLALLVKGMIVSLGYACLHSRSADCAVRTVKRESVDLVLSDIMMPGDRSGADLYHMLKLEHPGLPMILMTGDVDGAAEKFGLHDVPILAKPCTPERLSKALSAALGRRQCSGIRV